MAEKRFAAAALTAFATSLVERAGVRHDMAADVADVLVTGDLLGHTTHGLALLAPYLGEIERGTMTRTGEPDDRQRPARGADLGRPPVARTLAHAARARRRGEDGGE